MGKSQKRRAKIAQVYEDPHRCRCPSIYLRESLQNLLHVVLLQTDCLQIPIPSAAANIAGSALCFVFDIPERVNSYNDAVDRVFTDVSSTLSQFRIYESTGHINSAVHAPLVEQVHLVMVSMVRICAHVVKYRQGGVRHRIKNQLTSIFENNTPLNEEMSEFRRLLQAQRDVEGTVTLSVLIETQLGVAELLEGKAVFGKMLEVGNLSLILICA